MYETLICNALEQASLNDDLNTTLEDQLRRVFALDAECPLDIQSLQGSYFHSMEIW